MKNLQPNQTPNRPHQARAPSTSSYQPHHCQRPPKEPPLFVYYEEQFHITNESSENKGIKRKKRPMDDNHGQKIDNQI